MSKEGAKRGYDYIECLEFQIKEDIGITPEYAAEILGIRTKSRENEICFKRAWFWQMLYDKFKKNKNKLTLQKLGEITGGHNHATVLIGAKQARSNELWLMPFREEVLEVVNRVKYYKNEKGNSIP